LLAPHFWEHHYQKISIAWALVLAIPFLAVYGGIAAHELVKVMLLDYLPFVILLWGLYTVSGGIFLKGSMVGTPVVNLQILVIGTLLASWMGTTGASMLLIRPLLRANHARKRKTHIFVFFIFLVSNIGGLLTPLGDPPLFLGFLHGVPFFWTMKLLPEFLLVSGLVLLVFFVIDSIYYKQDHGIPEKAIHFAEKHPLKLEGFQNILFLIGIMVAVLLSGTWDAGRFTVWGIELKIQDLTRDLIIVAMGMLSLRFTHPKIHKENNFNWEAMKEVAWLFFGIFVTIIPVIMMLRAGVHGHFSAFVSAVSEPWHFFWMTGLLSSFLDNAPTYLTFFNMALGQVGLSEADISLILRGLVDHPEAARFIAYLKAVSCGAVFMGANTYIGNAPNFMVRSIVQGHHVKMPSFFGYMLWSGAILVPVFIITTLVFF